MKSNNQWPLEFTERMAGHGQSSSLESQKLPLSRDSFCRAELSETAEPIEFTLTIKIKDVPSFIDDPHLEAPLSGTVTIPSLSPSPIPITDGWFNLFVPPTTSNNLNVAKEMHYTFFFNHLNQPYTFYGFKEIIKEEETQIWKQTTTLYFYLWRGHERPDSFNLNSNVGDRKLPMISHIGILHISVADFLKQLTTFRSTAPTEEEQQKAFLLFAEFFAGKIWESYAPAFFSTTSKRWNEHVYPIHTTEGVVLGKKKRALLY